MGTPAAAQGLRVAAASDLRSVMPVIAAEFQKTTGHAVTPTFGSSGNFFSQIQNGAPFDLFFSADIDYPRRLEADGLVERGSVVTYAIGRLVLWTRTGRGVDVQRGLQALLDPAVRHIAIANPDTAPYGRAAVAALRHEQIYDGVRAKLVMGDNVAQAAQFVDSGNAEAGLISHSLSLDPALKQHGTYFEVPQDFHPVIEQAAAVVQASGDKTAAHLFLDFFQRPEIVKLMESYGFVVAPAAARR